MTTTVYTSVRLIEFVRVPNIYISNFTEVQIGILVTILNVLVNKTVNDIKSKKIGDNYVVN